MNNTIKEFAKKQLKKDMKQLREEEINKFKRMYGRVEQHVEDVIDAIPGDELDHALTLVQNTLERYD